MLNLKGFRKKVKGLPELLPYLLLADNGIVVNKDGSLTAAWEFKGPDMASSTIAELDQVAGQVNQAFMKLGSGWMAHVDAVRRPATSYPKPALSHFPDPVSLMIDEERRAFFTRESCFITSTILTLTFKPERSLAMAMLGDPDTVDKILEDFKRDIRGFESILSGVLKLDRLDEYEDTDVYGLSHNYSALLSHLQQCLTGDFRPVMIPRPCPMFLDGILGGQDLVGGMEPSIGGKPFSVVSIDGFPAESEPAILEVLSSLPMAYRYNTRFILKDKRDAINEIEEARKAWSQMMIGWLDKYFKNPNPKINRDAALMNEDAERAKADAQGELISFGHISSTVILMHENREYLQERALDVQRVLSGLGFGARIETHNAVEAWLGSHPGNWWANVRRPVVSTLNLAHMLPLSGIWLGEAVCPCPFYPAESPPLMLCTTDGTTPFRFNLHVGDLGHTLIIGPTGAGKSTLLGLICAQFRRYPKAQIFVFDKGMSMFPLCMAIGGTHYDIGGDESKMAFAPLRRIDESAAELAWACDWLDGLYQVQGERLTPEERELLTTKVLQLKNQPRDKRPLNILRSILPPHSRLQAGLSHYCDQGPMARLLDASDDNFSFSDFLVFEIEELMNMGEMNMIPVLLYLFRRIEKTLDGRPTLLVLDEAWLMLGNPVFKAKIREWLKVMRKANCAVVLATQSMSDASRANVLDVLSESCPTRIYLANYEAGNETQIDQYTALGLNLKQVELIAQAQAKRDYYVVTRDGKRRMMQLALGPRTLALVGASGKDDIAAIKDFINEFDSGWVERWLKHKRAA
ncbi:MAG: DUF87 domain-containing protein [Candidatus Adiutrix sp.]|jgi:type IV secretion system protein VirB4|nr:DUF87 domain-containing protein [Candidatus Adiutrix sp.]